MLGIAGLFLLWLDAQSEKSNGNLQFIAWLLVVMGGLQLIALLVDWFNDSGAAGRRSDKSLSGKLVGEERDAMAEERDAMAARARSKKRMALRIARQKKESAKIIEAAIRKQIKKPEGELTKADYEKVEQLFLDNNQLTNVSGLEKLTQLKYLNLRSNPALTKARIDQLQKALPKCDIISNPTK